ncbi:MAG: NmrA family NAD(P)-binding protein [Paludibacter sp.]|nr:NmrA family NAD(P)-binding protein [Paludibacter sp.]
MRRILITGATGNIGMEVIRFLYEGKTENQLIAGVRDISKAKKVFSKYPQLEYVSFDFEDSGTFDQALENTDTIFLLRPPHISDVPRYFQPLIAKISQKGIRRVVFLSVQGAETSKIIPHNKIEKLIREYGLEYIFMRPGYFMQNLTTTLIRDIQLKRQIILPAGNAKFNWIDVEDIGAVAAKLLESFDTYKNQAIELTGTENENFPTVTTLLNKITGENIEYININPFKFYQIKKKESVPTGMIIVMILLHFIPRFQKEPRISDSFERITGKKPGTLREFIFREKTKFRPFKTV